GRGLLRLALAGFPFDAGFGSRGPSIAASAASATFVSAEVVSVASSAPSKNRASSSSPTRWIRFSLCGGFAAAVFFGGFLAMRPFYDPHPALPPQAGEGKYK